MYTKAEDEKFMRFALQQARCALGEDELPVGAVLVADGQVLAGAYKSKDGNHRLDHAETQVLRKVFQGYSANAKGMCLYTTLEPCVMCFGTMLNVRLDRIVYAMEDPYGGAVSVANTDFLPPRHRPPRYPEVVAQVLRHDARMLFKSYLQTTDNEFWRDATDNPLARACLL
jgi:tRNA(adenine34) deaminase